MAINIEELKRKLEEEKTALENQLKEIGRKNPENPSDWETKPDENVDVEFNDEIAEHLEEMDEKEATEIELEHRFRDVESALQKIAQGNYGVCEIGGEAIEEDRLAANPAARTCKKHLNA